MPAEDFRGLRVQHGDFFGVDQHHHFLASVDIADPQVAQFPVVSQGHFPVLVDVVVAVPELAVAGHIDLIQGFPRATNRL